MNSPEKNNYVQYVNKSGIVKAKNVVFDNDGTTTKFTVSGIDEEFFIFAVYENNIQRFCVGIENLDNTDMLGFINSNMVDLSCIPEYAYCQPQTSVELSYNNEYVEKFKFGKNLTDLDNITNVDKYDTDDLKLLKSWVINEYGSLDGFFIEAVVIKKKDSENYYTPAGTVLFGRLTGALVYFKDIVFQNPANLYAQGRDGSIPMFMTGIENIEGSQGFAFSGYRLHGVL